MIHIHAEILYRIFKPILSINKYRFILEVTYTAYYIVISHIEYDFSYVLIQIPFYQLLAGNKTSTYVLPASLISFMKSSTLKDVIAQDVIEINDSNTFKYLDVEYILERSYDSYIGQWVAREVDQLEKVNRGFNNVLNVLKPNDSIYLNFNCPSLSTFSNDSSTCLVVNKQTGICGSINTALYLNCFLKILDRKDCYIDKIWNCIYGEFNFPGRFKELNLNITIFATGVDDCGIAKFNTFSRHLDELDFTFANKLTMPVFYQWLKRTNAESKDRVKLCKGYVSYEQFKNVFGGISNEQQLGGLKSVSSYYTDKLAKIVFESEDDLKFELYFAKLRKPE